MSKMTKDLLRQLRDNPGGEEGYLGSSNAA